LPLRQPKKMGEMVLKSDAKGCSGVVKDKSGLRIDKRSRLFACGRGTVLFQVVDYVPVVMVEGIILRIVDDD